MAFPEPKKPTYKLRYLADKWGYSISDLFYLAEDGKLQICKQQDKVITNPFDSDEEQEAARKLFNKDPIPIDHIEARELEKNYPSHLGHGLIYLVITYDEKTRFENKYDIPTTHKLEKYPGSPNEKPLVGWRAICEPFGLKVSKDGKKPKSMNQHTEKDNFPLMRMPNNKPYTYLSQIKEYLASSQKK